MPTLLVLTSVVAALPYSRAWFHPASHPVYALFIRDVAAPGSAQWAAQYPTPALAPIPEALTPPAWVAALQAAEQAGRIPNITVPLPTGGNPIYAPTDDPAGPAICSSTYQCRGAGDRWDAPQGHVGIGFDDGPSDGSSMLYQFLQQQKQNATHFMIGINILTRYALFSQAFNTLQHDIAVHTWTHPYTTTQNNTQVLAQLGWTMQIIHDTTGRVPLFWRPPYGDSDNRVRAIAREVFALTQINWNHDSADWTMASGRTTLPRVEAALASWYAGPKTPGLIILEHELTDDTVRAFADTYPVLLANGWSPVSTVQLFGGAYRAGDVLVGQGASSAGAGAGASANASAGVSASAGTNVSVSVEGSAGATSVAPSSSPSPSQATSSNKSVNGAAHTRVVSVLRTLLALVVALALALR